MTACLACTLLLQAVPVKVETKNISLVINADEGKAPEYVYFGTHLRDGDADAAHHADADRDCTG